MPTSTARHARLPHGVSRHEAPTPEAVVEATVAEAIGLLKAGRPDHAGRCLDRLHPAQCDSAAHCGLIGRVYATARQDKPALRWFDRALALQPARAEAMLARAGTLARLGELAAAIEAFAAAFRIDASDPVAFYTYGSTLNALGRAEEALGAFDTALQLRPTYPEARRAAGAVLRDLGRLDGALRLFDETVRLAPDYRDAALDHAHLLHALGHFGVALAAYDAALLRWPRDPLLWSNRGMVLHDLGRMDEACASLDTALACDPLLVQAHHNRSNVLFRLGDFSAALAASETALRLRPAYPDALCSRGLTLKMLGRFDESMASFEAALRQDPGSIYARANRGELKLLLGLFDTGWADYDLRFFTERQAKPALKTPAREWTGQIDPGASVVVFADQGNGDTIQFARFLPMLAATGARVTFVCPARLQRVLRDLTAGIVVRDAVDDDETFDYQIALSSMPGAFRTDLETLAGSAPYLQAEPDRVRHWAERLGAGGLKVGLCWRGSQHWQCDPNRSLPLAAFAPLAHRPDVRLISLQLPDNAAAGTTSLPITYLGAGFDDGPDAFVDTAAVMANLDLVVTCDTSIAHLAGALGRPTAVLLQAVPEWRWMLGRDTSPWYPTLRLYRQTRQGDWRDPVARVDLDLDLHRADKAAGL